MQAQPQNRNLRGKNMRKIGRCQYGRRNVECRTQNVEPGTQNAVEDQTHRPLKEFRIEDSDCSLLTVN